MGPADQGGYGMAASEVNVQDFEFQADYPEGVTDADGSDQ